MPEGPEVYGMCQVLRSLGFKAACVGKHLFYSDWNTGKSYDVSFGVGGKMFLYPDMTLEKINHIDLPSGYIKEISSFSKGKEELNLGLDWLLATEEDISDIVSRWGCRKKQIKALLVDQHEICGIGSKWVQKILRKANINPKEKANTFEFLSLREPLVKAIIETRDEAVKFFGKNFPKDKFKFVNNWNEQL